MTAFATRVPDVGAARRWPDVFTVPSGPRAIAAGRVAGAIFRHAAQRLPLRVALPGGRTLGLDAGAQAPLLVVRDEARMMRRIGQNGLIGFGESYLAGEWEAPDLAAVIAVFASSVEELVPRPLQAMRRFYLSAHPRSDRPTATGSRHNVERHYDLSNDLFTAFLDSTMTYSSGLFTDPEGAGWDDLATAQERKIDRILDEARVGPGSRVLEIGTGWGSLAVRAAQRGARVDSVTLSTQQLDYTRERAAREGVGERIDCRLQDYREVHGRYDAVVSVEMIEAVGLDFLAEYFRTLSGCLDPGGRIVLQAITMPHRRALETRNTYTWIHKYIFPGGALPSVRMLREHAASVGLQLADDLSMGRSYAATLRLWAGRFADQTERVDALGFDEVFRRMWSFYLRYSQGGFQSGYLDVHQLTFEAAA